MTVTLWPGVGSHHRGCRQAAARRPPYTRSDVVRVRHVVAADETRLRMVRDKTGKTKNGFVWTFGARDDEGELEVAYVFAEDRSGSTPKTLLEGTTGVLLVDGYSGYNIVDEVSTRRRAACHAHVRRYFHEALPTAPVAQEILDLVAELYVAEHAADAQGLVGAAKLDLRKQRAGPIRERMRQWLDVRKDRHPPKSPVIDASSHLRPSAPRRVPPVDRALLALTDLHDAAQPGCSREGSAFGDVSTYRSRSSSQRSSEVSARQVAQPPLGSLAMGFNPSRGAGRWRHSETARAARSESPSRPSLASMARSSSSPWIPSKPLSVMVRREPLGSGSISTITSEVPLAFISGSKNAHVDHRNDSRLDALEVDLEGQPRALRRRA